MADKKLLEEATIRRFMQLANITPSEKGVLKENASEVAGGRSATPTRGTSGKVATAGQTGPIREKKKAWEGKKEDLEEVEEMEEADDAEMDMGDMDAAPDLGDMGGDDAGMEGGELESAVEDVVSALNKVFMAAGLDKEVEVDSGSEDAGEDMGMDDMSAEEEGGAPMMESEDADEDDEDEKVEESEKVEEDLDESIELVDDALIEKLVKRVSDRLVAEARKLKEAKLAEGAGKGWLMKKPHSKPKKGHGAGKGKKSTPFSKSVSGVKGTAGRGR